MQRRALFRRGARDRGQERLQPADEHRALRVGVGRSKGHLDDFRYFARAGDARGDEVELVFDVVALRVNEDAHQTGVLGRVWKRAVVRA